MVDTSEMSEWLRMQIGKIQSACYVSYTIGPKISYAYGKNDILVGVGEEMKYASLLPEFDKIKKELVTMATYFSTNIDDKGIAQVRIQLNELGQTPIQKEFCSAMIYNLDFMANLIK